MPEDLLIIQTFSVLFAVLLLMLVLLIAGGYFYSGIEDTNDSKPEPPSTPAE